MHIKDEIKKTRKKLPSSSSTGRKSGRANAGLELINLAPTPNKPLTFGAGAIPIKTMQALVSLYAALHVDTNLSEKLLHLGQACLACGLIALNITLYLRNEDCEIPGIALCQSATILEMIYVGIIFTGFGAGEILKNKEPGHVPGSELPPGLFDRKGSVSVSESDQQDKQILGGMV